MEGNDNNEENDLSDADIMILKTPCYTKHQINNNKESRGERSVSRA